MQTRYRRAFAWEQKLLQLTISLLYLLVIQPLGLYSFVISRGGKEGAGKGGGGLKLERL